MVQGLVVDVLVEDQEVVVFNEDLPRRIISKTLFPKALDRDIGKPIGIWFNRAWKVPCYLVGEDELNRKWDYVLGEGSGLEEIFKKYIKSTEAMRYSKKLPERLEEY